MAISFLQNVNFNKNEIQNIRIQNDTSDPTGAVTGQLYYNTTDSILRVYNGSDWLDLAVSTGGSAISGVTATNGVSATEAGGVVTIQHADTSTQDDVTNTGQAYIQSVDLDDFGHIVGLSSSTVTLAGLGYTGATDADNYGNFLLAGNTGVSDPVTSGGTVTIIGDGINSNVAGLEMTITNLDKGSAQNIFKNVAGDTGTAVADNNNDTLTIAGGGGITTSVTTDTLSVDVDSTVVRTTGAQSIGGNKTFSDNVSVTGNLGVSGNLTVSGSVVTTISETVNVEDSIMLLNSNAPDTPVDDSGFAVERGAQKTAYMIWDESEDGFIVGLGEAEDDASAVGGTITISEYSPFQAKSLTSETITLSGLAGATTDTNAFLVSDSGIIKTRTGAQVRSDIGAGTVTSVGVSVTAPLVVDSGSPVTSSGTIALSVSDASTTAIGVTRYATVSEAGQMVSGSVALTPASLSAFRATANIGDAASTVFDVSHGMNTRDVIVQIYDNSTYDTVYTDVIRTDLNNIRITFIQAPTAEQYRVLIYKI